MLIALWQTCVRNDFGSRSGSIWLDLDVKTVHFRTFWRSDGRPDEKRSTLTKQWQGAVKSRVRRPRATQNRPEIIPEACFERLSAKTGRKRGLASSRALFLDSPGRPGGAPRRSGSVLGASRGRPGSSRERPGASPKSPESPKVAPTAPESDLALI